METSDLLAVCEWTPETGHWREDWSTATRRPGERSVTTTLTISMLKLSVDKLDSQQVGEFISEYFSHYIFSLTAGAVAYDGSTNPYGLAASGVPVYLDQIACTGEETSLEQCTLVGIGMVSGCGHNQDSAVSCQIRQCKCTII